MFNVGSNDYYRRRKSKRNYSKAEKKTNGTCVYCGQRAQCIDHVRPVIHGGSNDEGNLVPSCNKCNGIASDHVFDTFEAKYRYISAKRFPALKYLDDALERLECMDMTPVKRSVMPEFTLDDLGPIQKVNHLEEFIL